MGRLMSKTHLVLLYDLTSVINSTTQIKCPKWLIKAARRVHLFFRTDLVTLHPFHKNLDRLLFIKGVWNNAIRSDQVP